VRTLQDDGLNVRGSWVVGGSGTRIVVAMGKGSYEPDMWGRRLGCGSLSNLAATRLREGSRGRRCAFRILAGVLDMSAAWAGTTTWCEVLDVVVQRWCFLGSACVYDMLRGTAFFGIDGWGNVTTFAEFGPSVAGLIDQCP